MSFDLVSFDFMNPEMLTAKQANTWDSAEVTAAKNAVKASLGSMLIDTNHVGSSYTVGQGADLDLALLVREPLCEAQRALENSGYELSSEGYEDIDGQDFACFRRGFVNLIVTTDMEWHDNFETAAEVCKALKLETKADRIIVHRIIMDNEPAEMALAYVRGIGL